MSRHRSRLAAILLVGGVITATVVFASSTTRDREHAPGALVVDRVHREVHLRATVHPGAMQRPFGVKGHHAIVWKKGRAATWALFRSEASDQEVRAALESLGAVPGENLTIASWTERGSGESKEPDKRVDGTAINVRVRWDGLSSPVELSSLLAERGHETPRLDFRYGGNERFQPEFKSGCIVCLYSCPGGAIGNRSHPIRDYVRDGVVYQAIRNRLPRAGSSVTMILKPQLEER
ncbi:MAG TPA: YdjY domain-containing protein [Thermoanaerobaculia bacterium]|nr:YdjY domain-containing protein [Thermoanaerobaculia bacterium]